MQRNAPTTPGAMRGAFVMEKAGYDSLSDLLTDLAEWSQDQGFEFTYRATLAAHRADHRRKD